ncbi:hypothetical protein EB232_35490 (plasmid) [Mesorhizobium sp. NZP2077]|nr:hypothetical protein EB232_35490 [Mesorhizobium sp. NZP2077]
MIERGDDLAPGRAEIIGRMSAIALADMEGIDLGIGREPHAEAWFDVVEGRDGVCSRWVAPMPPSGSSITRPKRSSGFQSGSACAIEAG